MLRIKRLDIIEEKCELLYKADFTQENFEKDFEIARGTWTAKDGLLPSPCHAQFQNLFQNFLA